MDQNLHLQARLYRVPIIDVVPTVYSITPSLQGLTTRNWQHSRIMFHPRVRRRTSSWDVTHGLQHLCRNRFVQLILCLPQNLRHVCDPSIMNASGKPCQPCHGFNDILYPTITSQGYSSWIFWRRTSTPYETLSQAFEVTGNEETAVFGICMSHRDCMWRSGQ